MADDPTVTSRVLEVKLNEAEVRNLQAFLERLVVEPDSPRFKSNIIKDDVLRLMRTIRDQTGVGLENEFMPEPSVKTDGVCVHNYSARGVCVLCGETKLH